MCIWQGPDWSRGHVRLEALLPCRSVYGNRADVDHLRREAVDYLNDGLTRLDYRPGGRKNKESGCNTRYLLIDLLLTLELKLS